MTHELAHAFLKLRFSERLAIMQRLDINFKQGQHESNNDHAKRILQEIDNAGMIRELEQLMRVYQ